MGRGGLIHERHERHERWDMRRGEGETTARQAPVAGRVSGVSERRIRASRIIQVSRLWVDLELELSRLKQRRAAGEKGIA